MRKTLTALFLALAGPAHALCEGPTLIETSPPETIARIEAFGAGVPYARGLVWQAVRGGTRLTLVGTIHVYDPRQDAQVEDLMPALEEADLLVTEVTAEDERAFQTRIATQPDLAFLTRPPSLLTLLGPDDWSLLEAEMVLRGIPGFLAAKFQPWYASMVLGIPPCMMVDVNAGRIGLDKRLQDAAARLGLPNAGLDDPATLIESMTVGTPEDQLRLLRVSLRADFSSDAVARTMTEYYFAGETWLSWTFARHLDLGLSAEDQKVVEDTLALFEQSLLADRNHAWIGRLTALAEDRSVVVAVGAAHLPGADGLLNLLDAEGFTLTRLD